MAFKKRRPWTSQPQEAVGLNHEVFAGTGRIGSWITSGLNPTVIDGRNAALVSSNIGTMSAGVGQGGLGIEGTASSSEQRLSDAHFGIGSTDYWLQITFEQRGYRSLGSGINVLGGYGTGWGVSGAWLYQFSDNKLAATMDGTSTTIAMAVALPNGTHTATLFSIGTTAYFYVDGQLIGTTTKSTPSEISATRLNLCSDIASSNALRTWNGRVYGAHFGIGTLSQAWAAFASANPWQLFAPRSIWVPVSAGGGGPTPAGTATETDASLTLSGVQLRAVGQAAETDAAQALVAVQIASTGRADETETALALTPVQITVAGLASETDTALALDAGAASAAGIALETDAALALAAVQIAATGTATEVDTALALTGLAGTAPGIASETDTAFALAAVQKLVAGAALEVDTALALSAPGGTLDLILKILTNRQELNPATGTFTLYDDDGTTVLYTTNAWADAAGTTPYSGGALRRIDALF